MHPTKKTSEGDPRREGGESVSNETIKVDKGITLTSGSGYGRTFTKYPWAQMEIGDSFLVLPKEGEELRYLAQKVSAMASTRGSRHHEKYTTRYRAEENGVRVWRIG